MWVEVVVLERECESVTKWVSNYILNVNGFLDFDSQQVEFLMEF